MSDSGSLDDELRRMARHSTEETASATNVDADLGAVHDRIAGRVDVAPIVPSTDRRLMWLSAAAATVLVAGVVAAVATRDRGETLQSATDDTQPIVLGTTTDVAATVTTLSTTSQPPDSTTTSLFDTTTTSPATTIADEAGPPPATTVAPVSPTTTSTTTTTTVPTNECWREPVPPPSLADGSPVGEPVVTDADKGAGTATYTWGEGDFAITQRVGEEPESPSLDDGGYEAIEVGDWEGIAGRAGDASRRHEIRLVDRASGCTVSYQVSGELIDDFGALVVAHAWLEFLGSGVMIPDGTHSELVSPVPYVAWTVVSGPATEGWPEYEPRRFAPDGSVFGPIELDALDQQRLQYPADIGSERRMGLVGGAQYEPCPGTEPIAIGLDGPIEVDTRLLESSASSIAGAPAGVVVVSRGVCPGGSSWGEPGTAVELVRVDLDSATEPSVFARFEPEEDAIGFLRGRWRVRTLDPSGRYVGAVETASTESNAYYVLDSLADDGTSGEPLVLPSGCEDDDRAMVAEPTFVADGFAVLARSCGSARALVVDVVSLNERSLVWSQVVEAGTPENYGGGLSGLSATTVNGEVWVLVSSGDRAAGDIRLRIRTVLLGPEAQTEITSLRPTIDYTFDVG